LRQPLWSTPWLRVGRSRILRGKNEGRTGRRHDTDR